VSPATSNTVAKIAHGISDTLITTCVSLAVKGGIPVIIVPSDYGNLAETPILIDREECALCEDCYPAWFCHAIERGRKSYRIDYRRCDGCGKCIPLCKIGAIKKEKFQVSQRDIDLKNIEIVKKMEGMKILEHPERIIREIKILQKRPLQD
jgi:dihydromethanopterin reductase (acceptor)